MMAHVRYGDNDSRDAASEKDPEDYLRPVRSSVCRSRGTRDPTAQRTRVDCSYTFVCFAHCAVSEVRVLRGSAGMEGAEAGAARRTCARYLRRAGRGRRGRVFPVAGGARIRNKVRSSRVWPDRRGRAGQITIVSEQRVGTREEARTSPSN